MHRSETPTESVPDKKGGLFFFTAEQPFNMVFHFHSTVSTFGCYLLFASNLKPLV